MWKKLDVIFDFKGSVFNQKENIKLDLESTVTVIEALCILTQKNPHLHSLIFKDDSLRNDILVIVDKYDVKSMELLEMQLKDGQKISILPLAHGG